jgi:hypothetical protein
MDLRAVSLPLGLVMDIGQLTDVLLAAAPQDGPRAK